MGASSREINFIGGGGGGGGGPERFFFLKSKEIVVGSQGERTAHASHDVVCHVCQSRANRPDKMLLAVERHA